MTWRLWPSAMNTVSCTTVCICVYLCFPHSLKFMNEWHCLEFLSLSLQWCSMVRGSRAITVFWLKVSSGSGFRLTTISPTTSGTHGRSSSSAHTLWSGETFRTCKVELDQLLTIKEQLSFCHCHFLAVVLHWILTRHNTIKRKAEHCASVYREFLSFIYFFVSVMLKWGLNSAGSWALRNRLLRSQQTRWDVYWIQFWIPIQPPNITGKYVKYLKSLFLF